MADILVLFASKGDEKAFKPIIDSLEKNSVSYEFKMASAHKTPDDVEHILKKRYKLIITGAGLAAALPGVVASKVLYPVIGVPCSGSLGGLDALLSIMQMPPGVPVLCTGVDKGEVAASVGQMILQGYKKVALGGEDGVPMRKAEELLGKFEVPFSKTGDADEHTLSIVFIQAAHSPKAERGLTIYCPVAEQGQDKPELALKLHKNASHGVWVGLNNGTNAAIGAVEILNIGGKYTKKLVDYRREQAEKVRAYNH